MRGAPLELEDRRMPRTNGQAKASCGLAVKRGAFVANDRRHGAFDP
jgi:hypothetical protein